MDNAYQLINEHLQQIDKQSLGDHCFFFNKTEKERYESYLMHSFRCLKAGHYHKKNIEQHKKEISSWANQMINSVSFSKSSKLKNISSSFKMNKSVDHFAYELFAFVASIKSSIDFLLTSTHHHLLDERIQKPIDIGMILKHIENKKPLPNSSLNKLSEYQEWLRYLNNYRNCLLHRSSIILHSGFEYWEQGKLNGTELFPITIPKEAQNFILDTREFRAFHNGDEHRLDKVISTLEITSSDGKKETIKHEINYSPSQDQIEIEDFMNSILNNYNNFITSYLPSLSFNTPPS